MVVNHQFCLTGLPISIEGVHGKLISYKLQLSNLDQKAKSQVVGKIVVMARRICR